jgi:hypothetical protein
MGIIIYKLKNMSKEMRKYIDDFRNLLTENKMEKSSDKIKFWHVICVNMFNISSSTREDAVRSDKLSLPSDEF